MTDRLEERYSRQMLFAPIGKEGQQKLQNSAVLIVGIGALGTVLANHFVRAGIGHVRMVDRDYVEASNLQRQLLFDEDDVRECLPKAVAAQQKLQKVNSDIKVEGIVADVTVENIHELMEGMDLVLDGTDNFQTRFLINDACFQMGLPFIYGGAVSSRGMTAMFIPEKTPCLRCFIQEGQGSGQTCDTVGVLGPVVDIVASFQAIEALKYLTDNEQAYRHSLMSFDVWRNHRYDMNFAAAKTNCPTCGTKAFPALHPAAHDSVTSLCGRETVQVHTGRPFDLSEWGKRLDRIADVQTTPFLVRVQLTEGERLVLFKDGRVLVQGTEDVSRAKTLVSKYIGL
ncbi:thiazole biosynthesis adenylyltransferase ThiF [Halalkalibacterium halodurans]|uniref:thiazole biosynthesis adenylyltransferase ThiF n=1 Tax=Halalkalibacterium halodurans TaxID=86665 RepID=UPI002AA9D33D|nr:thiazole biosynthesis adenylyltransferase ThiF [Halalkalibacterium halodurans]MDY7221943.1 thiazole biosynthesis adenylyltransferase ThiF [Halalkalibacterium halodurans]MDY7241219.1 thiazole biosynthesis adenylyltransferase ThiF [Halalkalibacterium halodurans]MED4080730.1 thiazole biosynthesis adenylyltransferase ThiF [Halalkalibacterium halodurans]MED4087182.1 thiazole biosynthesis adenylyltransferase ThiF [Halalkalibacterium halodurans]MED4107138.1 thiazole biosynthesis adenylyltransferas